MEPRSQRKIDPEAPGIPERQKQYGFSVLKFSRTFQSRQKSTFIMVTSSPMCNMSSSLCRQDAFLSHFVLQSLQETRANNKLIIAIAIDFSNAFGAAWQANQSENLKILMKICRNGRQATVTCQKHQRMLQNHSTDHIVPHRDRSLRCSRAMKICVAQDD